MAAKKPPAKRKPAAKKPAKKAAAKRKPAATPTPQVNRMPPTETPEAPPETNESEREETQEERDAAGAARAEKVRTPGKNEVEIYEPKREPLEHADFDHHAAEEKRQAELAAQRDEHNERVAHSRGFKF